MFLQFNDLIDASTITLIWRFLVNIMVITVLVRFIYFGYKKDKEYAFTFYVFNVLIFFVCVVMVQSDISMGFAFGLFAIFGILRYRTNTIPHKEMTYLFTAITVALINGIAAFTVSLAIMNVAILFFVFIMEKIWFSNKEHYKNILYEKVNLIQEGNEIGIIEDLKLRTGLNVVKFEVKSMNFVNDSAELKVFYIPS